MRSLGITILLLINMAWAQAQTTDFAHPRWYTGPSIIEPDSINSRHCANTYAPMYKDGQLNVSVFFGFNELTHSGIVVDPFNVRSFLRQLQQPCEGDIQACDFIWSGRPQTADQPFVLRKKVDYQGHPVEVRIRLFDSAVDDNYQHILKGLTQLQQQKTDQVKTHFLAALATEDAVFYQGHARIGTGPGFGPFSSFSQQWWKAVLLQPNLHAMLDTLSQRTRPLPMLGMYGCDTHTYYADALNRASPQTATLLSTGVTYTDADSTRLFGTLNAVLGQRCEQPFKQELAVSGDHADYQIDGLFHHPPAATNLDAYTQYQRLMDY